MEKMILLLIREKRWTIKRGNATKAKFVPVNLTWPIRLAENRAPMP
ncbi:hypothetical protein SD78_1344 [Bacillus badius]|nr:hypothetical protein SD78_1344 [Bacillus badius]